MRAALLSSVCTGLLLLAALPASAQTVNYGELEEIFGEPVTTSATGKPQKVSEVPVDMEIITQDDIRRSGADNLPDALQFVSGIDFRRSSFNDGEVGVRGYDQPWNPRLLVLLNGRPVYEDFYGDVVWAAIPVQLDEIRQIEVVKGPNSALFGFNAASGVINIVTYDPLHDSADAVTLRTGTQALKEGSAVATAHLSDDFGVRLSAGGLKANEFSTRGLPAENAAGLLRPETGTFNIDARWLIAPGVEWAVEGGAGTMKRNFPADETPENDRTTSIRTRLTAATDVGLVDVDLYRNTWNINYLGSQAQQAVNIADDLRVSDLFKIGADHTFRASFEYKYNQAQGQFFDRSTIDYSTYSGGLMWNWDIAPGVTLSNALREDHLQLGMKGGLLPQTGLVPAQFDRTLDATSFNSGLVYGVTAEDVVRLMASRGFQLPSLNDLGQQIAVPSGGYVEIGQPALKATSVFNVEGDYDHTFSEYGVTLRNAVYWQHNADLFGYDVGGGYYVGPNYVYQSANFGASDETGFEISLKKRASEGLRWNIGYKYAIIDDKIWSGIAPGAYSAFQGSTPRHTVDFGIGYGLDRWEFDLLGRWQSQFTDYIYTVTYGYQPVTLPDYVTLNAHVGFRATDWLTLGATAEQFDEARIRERAGLATDRRLIFSSTVAF